MNVVNPDNPQHTLTIIPRFYPAGDVQLLVYNETTKEEVEHTLTPTVADGYMTLVFTQDLADGYYFRVTLKSNNEIVYRGKMFCTASDNLQDFKLTKNYYFNG